jgi:hypothetical protein
MSQPTSIQMLDTAIWKELGVEEVAESEAFYHALATLLSRWLLARSEISRNGGHQTFRKGSRLRCPARASLVNPASEAPGSLVRGTVRISTSKLALFWGRQRRRAFQVTKSWSKAMTSKWKYRISVRAVILSLSYFVFPFVKPDQRGASRAPNQ